VIVRENTEDLYAGIEYESGTPEADGVIDYLNGLQKKQIRAKSGISIKPMSEFGSERIIRYAFQYAKDNGRKRVHCITKSNIMKFTDGLFLSVFREVAKDFPEIEPWENLVDATCMGLVTRPNEWDVLGPAQPVRRHPVRPDRRHGRWPRCRTRRQHRHRDGGLRGDARQRAEVQGPEQGQPDRDDPVRQADARLPRRDRGRDDAGERRRVRHRRGQERHLRHEARPQRPDRRRHREYADAVIEKLGGAK
jgi:hypothetical protein